MMAIGGQEFNGKNAHYVEPSRPVVEVVISNLCGVGH